MAFTREDLAAYEKQPAKTISDKVSPFRGATPAKAADAAALAAVAAGNVDATPGGAPVQAVANTDPLTDDAPVVDEDGTLGDLTGSGEGTSDETSDSSTDTVDPSDESDPNADLTAENADEASNLQAPPKGSARERIVEVLDLAEGYKIYGKAKEEEVKELRARLARHEAPAAPPPPPVVEEKDEPMPDMSDEDIAFDNDKYRVKMSAWVKTQGRIEARRELRAAVEQQAQRSTASSMETKARAFEKDHPDFKEKVRENEVLQQNPLHPIAGQAVGKSEHMAELLYAFGTDTDMAIRVAKMPPDEQLLYVGRMIEKIEARKPAPKGAAPQSGAKPGNQKSITKAPPPPRAVPAGGRPASRDVLDPSMGMEEFARQHRAGKQQDRAQNRKQRGLN